MLIASAEISRCLIYARASDIGFVPVVIGDVKFLQIVYHSSLGNALKVSEGNVVLDVINKVEPKRLAIFGDVSKAMVNCFANSGDIGFFSM